MNAFFSTHNAVYHPIANRSNIIHLTSQLFLDHPVTPELDGYLGHPGSLEKSFLTNASVKVTAQLEC